MSRRPLGPWAETQTNAHSVLIKNKLYTAIETDARTGVNLGRKLPGVPRIVTNSTRSIRRVVSYRQGLASVTSKCPNGTGGTTNVSGYGYFPSPSLGWNWPTAVGAIPSDKINRCFSRLVQNQRSSFQGIPVVGEAGKTAREMGSLIDIVLGRHNDVARKLAKDLVKNKKAALLTVSHIVSDAWLTWQFGIKPVIHDVEDFLKELEEFPLPPKNKVQAKLLERVSLSGLPSGYTVAPGWSGTIQWEQSTKTVVKMGYDIIPEKVLSEAKRKRSFGFDSADILAGSVELLPWSWLVAYFVNVDDFVSALSLHRGVAKNGYIVKIADQSRVYTAKAPKKISGCYPSIGFPVSSTDGVTEVQSFTYSRSTFDVDSFVPTLEFSLPDLTQAANVAAVAVGRVKILNRWAPHVKKIDVMRAARQNWSNALTR